MYKKAINTVRGAVTVALIVAKVHAYKKAKKRAADDKWCNEQIRNGNYIDGEFVEVA